MLSMLGKRLAHIEANQEKGDLIISCPNFVFKMSN